MQKSGYVKLHRKFLVSEVRRLKPSVVCVFIDFLLLADYKTGQIALSYRKLSEILTVQHPKTLKEALDELERRGVIKTQRHPVLIIQICNWKRYQSGEDYVSKSETYVSKTETKAFQKVKQFVSKSETLPIHKVPVSINVLKNKEYFFKEKMKGLNFENPKTDLEKLALFFAKGIKHPALGKADWAQQLAAALREDLPHLQTVLNNTADLQQAKDIVARFVRNSKGHYALYYLAQQVHSYRQELESEQGGKNGIF